MSSQARISSGLVQFDLPPVQSTQSTPARLAPGCLYQMQLLYVWSSSSSCHNGLRVVEAVV